MTAVAREAGKKGTESSSHERTRRKAWRAVVVVVPLYILHPGHMLRLPHLSYGTDLTPPTLPYSYPVLQLHGMMTPVIPALPVAPKQIGTSFCIAVVSELFQTMSAGMERQPCLPVTLGT